MSLRPIKQIIHTKPTIEGAGVKLQRAFGFGKTKEFDPFLLLDDFRNDVPEDYLAGFPWHPHRGIETITYVLAFSSGAQDTRIRASVTIGGAVAGDASGYSSLSLVTNYNGTPSAYGAVVKARFAVLGLAPLTGVPLPFVSYGGTSLVLTLAATGLILNVARRPAQASARRSGRGGRTAAGPARLRVVEGGTHRRKRSASGTSRDSRRRDGGARRTGDRRRRRASR